MEVGIILGNIVQSIEVQSMKIKNDKIIERVLDVSIIYMISLIGRCK